MENNNNSTNVRSLSLRALSLAAELLTRPDGVFSDAGEHLASVVLMDAGGAEYLSNFGYYAGLSSDAKAEALFALAVREAALERYIREDACDPRFARLSFVEELAHIRSALATARPA